MSNTNEINQCLICSEKYTIMISLGEYLNEYEKISVIQVLQNLNFFTISDTINFNQNLCLICVSKIQSCFEFKTLCSQINTKIKNLPKNPIYNTVTEPIFIPIKNIKEESNWEESENYTLDNVWDRKNESFENPLLHTEVGPEISREIKHPNVKIEVGIDGEKFECKQSNRITNTNLETTIDKPNEESPVLNPFRNCETEKDIKIEENSQSISQIVAQESNSKDLTNEKNVIDISKPEDQKAKVMRPYVCNVCNKSFAYSCVLATHTLIHTGEKPHVCDVCNRSFRDRSNFVKHKLIHTGEKRHVCEICNKSFTDRSNYIKHKVIHSGKLFVCDICNNSFRSHRSLIRHIYLHASK